MQTSKWLSIRASAGSGKTFALTLRYIYLLFLGARPNEILCITFTNKAKDEMLSRITNTLFALSKNPSDPYAKNLVDLGIKEEAIKAQSRAIYTHFVESKNHIMTFDAFFNTIVKKFSFYAGILSDYEIGADFQLNDEILKKTLDALSPREFGELVEFCAQHKFFQRDIQKMLNVLKIPHTPFVESADLDIANAFDDYRQCVLSAVQGQKGAHHIIKRFSREISASDICGMIKNVFDLTENMQGVLECVADSAVAQKAQNLKNLFSQYFKQRENKVLSQISDISQKFKTHKLEVIAQHNKLTFSDVSEVCYELLHNHIDKNFFYFRLDSKINHILIDEFQDTNLMQFENLQPLISEIKSGKGVKDDKTLFFVGDEKQAIYGFRGGESRLFRAISDELQMSEHTLKDNYRSAKNIVNFVNETFKNHFANYQMQNPKSDISGLVEIVSVENEAQSVLNAIKQRVEILLANHKKNIAILTRGGASAEEIYLFLRSHFPHNKITLDATNSNNNEFLIILNALRFLQTDNIFYLKICAKLNGNALDSAPKIAIKKDVQVHKIVHYIIETFALYGNTALQVLEESAKFDELDEFVAHLRSAEIKNALEMDGEIQIMTIHKSKGLEFEDVIVCELKSAGNNWQTFYAPDVRGERVYYMKDAKERGFVDDEFAKVLSQRDAQNKNDALNVLYVAFTRAKDSLFIINMDKNKGKNALHLDLLALSDMKIGEDILSAQSTQSTQSTAQIPAQYHFGKQSDFINKDGQNYTTISKVRGIALHLALEMRLAYQNSDDEIWRILRGKFGLILDEGERAQILQNMGKILQNPKLKGILEVAKSIKCEVSYLENKCLRRIDCLIEVEGGAVILDYKSSDLNLEAKKAQILQYADFARKHYKGVSAYLCFANGEILEVG